MKDEAADAKNDDNTSSDAAGSNEKVREKSESEQSGNEIKQVSGDTSETTEAKTTQGEEEKAEVCIGEVSVVSVVNDRNCQRR